MIKKSMIVIQSKDSAAKLDRISPCNGEPGAKNDAEVGAPVILYSGGDAVLLGRGARIGEESFSFKTGFAGPCSEEIDGKGPLPSQVDFKSDIQEKSLRRVNGSTRSFAASVGI